MYIIYTHSTGKLEITTGRPKMKEYKPSKVRKQAEING
jgi:hypothetical protein